MTYSEEFTGESKGKHTDSMLLPMSYRFCSNPNCNMPIVSGMVAFKIIQVYIVDKNDKSRHEEPLPRLPEKVLCEECYFSIFGERNPPESVFEAFKRK